MSGQQRPGDARFTVNPPCLSRFTKTVPLTSLPAVINATEHKPACFSLFPSGGQSEDCLYLNVWVPADAGRPLAVMVWVHGGGFITGSSASNQGALLAAENDVIVVSMNYRQVVVWACRLGVKHQVTSGLDDAVNLFTASTHTCWKLTETSTRRPARGPFSRPTISLFSMLCILMQILPRGDS